MENENTFKTKTGYCHILPDKIILTRNGIIGDISKITVANGINRILIIYSVLSAFLIYNAFTAYQKGDNFSILFFGLLSLFLIYGIVKSKNNSATPIINRNKITEVKFIDSKPGLTRAVFKVMFEDDKGKLKKSLIMLPGSLSDGQNETEKAVQLMKKEGLLK
ncbi:phosphoribosylaminoimidazolesuccinocarboxamide synthase [Flavobacterium amniphilum]|uniref:phosphoribosylaminoimidazolesuccinocarboxamide synthase n=1 Tax=Flavobacterium amniphilum TaxID=1834035 RepID=UPI00202A4ACF|nr:phosphoribosylaminoimidazolesuccinocarboxamide synthase [Flavobacterium amniphilum]MCL9806844.1 phosphoribosylaminoimidazolesuccinocarboxamide synthase [Flavobacterium amniphilum]